MSDTNNQDSLKNSNPLPPSARDIRDGDNLVNWMSRSQVRGTDASPVGAGVHKQFVAPAAPGPEPKKADEVEHKLSDAWGDKPTLKDQMQRQEGVYWKFDRVESRIYDLADPEQVKQYNDLLTRAHAPDTGIALLKDESKYSEKTDSWKVFTVTQHVKFRQILITEKNQDDAL